jgi:uncharacterized membrane protein YhaH (DUF805 family)
MLLATLIAIPLLLIWGLTLVDILRRHDLHASGKVLWALFVLVIPVIGVIVYFIARPPQASDRPETLDAVGDEHLETMQRHGPA